MAQIYCVLFSSIFLISDFLNFLSIPSTPITLIIPITLITPITLIIPITLSLLPPIDTSRSKHRGRQSPLSEKSGGG